MRILDKLFGEFKLVLRIQPVLAVFALSLGGCASPSDQSSGLVSQEPARLVVRKADIVRSALTVKDKESPVLSFAVEARGSDMMLTEVTVEVGQDIRVLMDSFHSLDWVDHRGKVVAFHLLDRKAFELVGSEYRLVFGGIKSMIPRDSTRFFTLRANPYRSDTSEPVTRTHDFAIPFNGIECLTREGNYVFGPDFGRMVQTISLSPSKPKG